MIRIFIAILSTLFMSFLGLVIEVNSFAPNASIIFAIITMGSFIMRECHRDK